MFANASYADSKRRHYQEGIEALRSNIENCTSAIEKEARMQDLVPGERPYDIPSTKFQESIKGYTDRLAKLEAMTDDEIVGDIKTDVEVIGWSKDIKSGEKLAAVWERRGGRTVLAIPCKHA